MFDEEDIVDTGKMMKRTSCWESAGFCSKVWCWGQYNWRI